MANEITSDPDNKRWASLNTPCIDGTGPIQDNSELTNGANLGEVGVDSLLERQLDTSLRIIEEVFYVTQKAIAKQLIKEYEKLSMNKAKNGTAAIAKQNVASNFTSQEALRSAARAPPPPSNAYVDQPTEPAHEMLLGDVETIPISEAHKMEDQNPAHYGQNLQHVQQLSKEAPSYFVISDNIPRHQVIKEVQGVNQTEEDAQSDISAKELAEEQEIEQMKKQTLFEERQSIKDSVRRAIEVKEYNVHDWYNDTRISAFARNPIFENVTLGVIALNSLWIAIDTDHNNAEVLITADLCFQVMEHIFCSFFVFEWFVRFLSFEKTMNCRKDAWFVFDSFLVALMVLEDWIMSIYLISTGETSSPIRNTSLLRLFRLLRMMRMFRMAKLMRAFPELLVLVKGIGVASRSVFFTLMLLMSVVYVFGIIFTQLTKDTDVGKAYFDTVPQSMYALLIRGTLPDLTDFCNEMNAENIAYGALFLVFVLLASLTIMNMLVGILVEVVGVVAKTEKEESEAAFLKQQMLKLISSINEDGDDSVSRSEVQAIMEKPGAVRALHRIGVDVINLVDLIDFIFKDREELEFGEFMEVVLQLRGSNAATVKDVMDLRKTVTYECKRIEELVEQKTASAGRQSMRAAARVRRQSQIFRSNSQQSFCEAREV